MIIYKVTNRINNKVYIGQTVKSLSQRWKQHCAPSSGCTALHNAIAKYGAENFTVEQIDVACSREELDEKEKYWIAHYDSFVPRGYNLSEGGDGCRGYKHNDDTKALLSRMRIGKGHPHSDEWKALMSERQKGRKHPHKGHALSEEQRKLLSDIHKGKANPKKFKAIFCIETGETYCSRKDAAAHIGVKPAALTNAIKRGNKCGGFHWEYVSNKAV